MLLVRVAQEPETGTVGTVFPETESGTGTAGTVVQEPKPEPEPSFPVKLYWKQRNPSNCRYSIQAVLYVCLDMLHHYVGSCLSWRPSLA